MLRHASYSFISEWNEMNNIFYNVLNKLYKIKNLWMKERFIRTKFTLKNFLDKLYLKINITCNIT